MRLVHNWREILTKAHSIRVLAGGVVIETAVEFLPYIGEWIPRWLVIIIMAGAMVSRVVKQFTITGDA